MKHQSYTITISNTLSGKKEPLVTQDPGVVKLYVCGITPYDYPHIGHGRVYVTFDVLVRLLTFLGYNVTYVRNFTDIDDKLINRAERELGDPLKFGEIANTYITAFGEDMKALGTLPPNHEPRVTDSIDHIIQFVKGLIDSGHAYEVNGDVYFSIPTFARYGALSKRNIDDLQAGARVEINDTKKNPLDFALWKSEPEGHYYKSPWGYGRPGWHIECSAMVRSHLGDTLDIHGGGMDLIFPHHENEVAQSEALTQKPLARYWMHNAFVRINQEKMSKSLGNFFTLRDVFKEFDPMLVRYLYLQHQYRNPLDFSFDELTTLIKSYKRLVKLCHDATTVSPEIIKNSDSPIIHSMLKFLCDDLNTPGMFGVVFEHFNEIEQNNDLKNMVTTILTTILGLTLEPIAETTTEITPEIAKLIQERNDARSRKDYKTADMLRDQLLKLGVSVHDKA